MKRNNIICLILILLLISGCAAQPQPVTVTETTPTESIPVFSQPEAVRDFLTGTQQLKFSFTYTQAVPLTAEQIARMGSYLYVECIQQDQSYEITVWEYPGVRMVRAYREGRVDALAPEEAQALSLALEMVEKARETSDSPLGLELALFDSLRSHVSYHPGSAAVSDPEDPPRHLTAVGALLDGSANCQGYADAFYVLAALADFPVEKVHVDTPEGGHVVNLICLEGNWYVVDVTFSDQPEQQVSYRLFNAGMDQCGEYTWDPVMTPYTISPVSDCKYYYHPEFDGTKKVFSDLDAMAENILREYRDQGVLERYLVLEGKTAGWADLSDALEKCAKEWEISLVYHIWAEKNQNNTFYYIKIQ